MKAAPFEYYAPETLVEATALLSSYGEDAKLLAGGQSLIPLMALRLATPSILVDLNRIGELAFLADEGDWLRVGALVRHREMERVSDIGQRCPMLAEAVQLIGHVAIRNRGTVGGSLAHADPSAEWAALALALDSTITVVGPNGTRTIPAEEFFVSAMTTSLHPDEVATEIRLSFPKGRVGSSFVEVSRRHGDFALAGVGAWLTLNEDGRVDDSRIVLIGVEDTPRRMRDAEGLLRDQRPTAAVVEDAADMVYTTVDARGDIHASVTFRRSIAKVLTRRAIATATRRATGGEDG